MRDKAILPLDDRYEICINAFLPAANNHLFNEVAFFRIHACSADDVYAQLVRKSDLRVCATIAFYALEDHIFASPRTGTFGGLGLNHPVDNELLESFLDSLLGHLHALGARSIQVKLAPLSHDLPLLSTVANAMLLHNAVVSSHELNFDMRVDGRSFEERIDIGNAKRIRKCLREGFIAEELDISALDAAYQTISANRKRRGYSISMTQSQLTQMASTFPDRFRLFAVFCDADRSRIAAAAICLAISSSILYVFYWGDAEGMASHSPIALLASCIYGFCQRHAFAILDVGTSTVEGKSNHGLIRFKQHLGFAASIKLSLTCQT
jgi:hypothetical protein